jgi:hypothetical protein
MLDFPQLMLTATLSMHPSTRGPRCHGCDEQYLDAIPWAMAALLVLYALHAWKMRARSHKHRGKG